MSPIECSRAIAICANKLQPRSVWQNSQNDRPPFWFTEKVYESAMKSTHRQFALVMSEQEIRRSSQGGWFTSYMSSK